MKRKERMNEWMNDDENNNMKKKKKDKWMNIKLK